MADGNESEEEAARQAFFLITRFREGAGKDWENSETEALLRRAIGVVQDVQRLQREAAAVLDAFTRFSTGCAQPVENKEDEGQ